jgi:hypothetical protein
VILTAVIRGKFGKHFIMTNYRQTVPTDLDSAHAAKKMYREMLLARFPEHKQEIDSPIFCLKGSNSAYIQTSKISKELTAKIAADKDIAHILNP